MAGLLKVVIPNTTVPQHRSKMIRIYLDSRIEYFFGENLLKMKKPIIKMMKIKIEYFTYGKRPDTILIKSIGT